MEKTNVGQNPGIDSRYYRDNPELVFASIQNKIDDAKRFAAKLALQYA